MASVADPLTHVAQRAAVALAEANAAGTSEDKEERGYGQQCAITAMDQVALVAKKYSVSREAKARADGLPTTMPIIADAGFRRAMAHLAERVRECAELLGAGGGRLSDVIGDWLESSSPDCALVLQTHAETVERILKRKAAG